MLERPPPRRAACRRGGGALSLVTHFFLPFTVPKGKDTLIIDVHFCRNRNAPADLTVDNRSFAVSHFACPPIRGGVGRCALSRSLSWAAPHKGRRAAKRNSESNTICIRFGVLFSGPSALVPGSPRERARESATPYATTVRESRLVDS